MVIVPNSRRLLNLSFTNSLVSSLSAVSPRLLWLTACAFVSFSQGISLSGTRHWMDEDPRSPLFEERHEHRVDAEDQAGLRSSEHHEPRQSVALEDVREGYAFMDLVVHIDYLSVCARGEENINFMPCHTRISQTLSETTRELVRAHVTSYARRDQNSVT